MLELTWYRHRRSILWVLGFVVVIWIAFTVTAPQETEGGSIPGVGPAAVTMPLGCPLSAPNAAAGCVIINSP